MAIKWEKEKESNGIQWDSKDLSRSQAVLGSSQRILDTILGASNLVNQTIGRPFIDIAAMPVQAGAKKLGLPDPYADKALGGVDVASVDEPLRKAGSAGELASYAFPFKTAATGLANFAKPLLGKAAGLFGNVGAGAGAGYGVDVAMDMAGGEQDIGEVLKPGAATAIGGGLPAVGAIGGAVRNAIPKLLSYTSDVPEEAFSMMLQRRAPVMSAVQSGVTPEQSLQASQQAVRGLRKKLSQEWEESAQAIYDEFADKSILFSGSLERKLHSVATEFGLDLPQNLKNVSAKETMDLLKKIGELPRGVLTLSPKGAVVREVQEGIKDKAIEAFGGKKGSLATLYKNYSTKKGIFDAANDIVKAYSTGKPIQQSSALGRLMAVFNENKGAYLDAILDLERETGTDLLSNVIATKISPVLPSASSAMTASGTLSSAKSLTDKALNLLLLPLTSPRTAAFLARVAGRMKIPPLQRTPGDDILDRSKQIIQEEGGEGGFVRIPKAKGGTPKDAPTLQSLTRMAEEVKIPTVSRRYIEDLSNRPDIKQPERDLLRKFLADEGDEVDVANFANKIKTELLPLKRNAPKVGDSARDAGITSTRYENVTLPSEQRGPVSNYSEHVYESPIETSAGKVHFGNSYDGANKGYFAHTRIEDVGSMHENALTGASKTYAGDTRRVIEIQSDLFQKGRLEDEMPKIGEGANRAGAEQIAKTDPKSFATKELAREAELKKLEPYRNTWWERIVREEVKQAAKDGKTKLQFPTGETAMKIEGLGIPEGDRFQIVGESVADVGRNNAGLARNMGNLTADKLKVGTVYTTDPTVYGRNNYLNADTQHQWVITDVLGDGKFKAMPKEHIDSYAESAGLNNLSTEELLNYAEHHATQNFWGSKETFDISGKVDTNNPIYKFYEKDVQKYLTNKYKGKVITDPQGVKWVEIDVPKEAKRLPVEAFGVGAVTLPGDKGIFETEGNPPTDFEPTPEDVETRVNEFRASQGLPSLRMNPELSSYAQERAEEMASSGVFSHYSPGETEQTAIQGEDFEGLENVYENIAWGEKGFSDATSTSKTWEESKTGHREILLNPNISELGTGVAKGKYRGKDAFFVAQMYGIPSIRPSAATIERSRVPEEGKAILSLRVLPISNFETRPMETDMAASTPRTLQR